MKTFDVNQKNGVLKDQLVIFISKFDEKMSKLCDETANTTFKFLKGSHFSVYKDFFIYLVRKKTS